MKRNVYYLTQAALIAALYVVLTLFINAFDLANGAIQVRISEALTILPFFTPAAIPGVFLGCLISNIVTGCMPLDVIFGSLATLLGAFGTYYLSKVFRGKSFSRFLASIPPIVANTLIIPFILAYVYMFEGGVPFFMLTVCAGEILSCGVLGLILLSALYPFRSQLFGDMLVCK